MTTATMSTNVISSYALVLVSSSYSVWQ